MEISLFLAKLLGLYMLIVSLIWACRKKEMDLSIREILSSRPVIVYSGFLNILLGLAIVIVHSVWTSDFRLIVTLIGYLILLKGIIQLTLTSYAQQAQYNTMTYMYWHYFLWPLIGGYLTYAGFFGPHLSASI